MCKSDFGDFIQEFVLIEEKKGWSHVQVLDIPQVDISDALSEKDKVKFTVHTRTGNTAGDAKTYELVNSVCVNFSCAKFYTVWLRK